MIMFSRKNESAMIGVIVIACFLALYNTSSMNVALPEFMRHFNASVMVVQWVSIGYTVVMGVASPLSSWFVRRFTLRNYFIYSMWGYALLSLLSGMVDNIYFMIIIRAIQGVCGAALIPVTMIAIYRFIPRSRQPLFLTIQNMSISLGPAVGPVLAGLILTVLSWRWIYWSNVPLSAAAALLATRCLPKEERDHGTDTVDVAAIASIVTGSMLVLLGFSLADTYGITSPAILGMIAVGLVLCAWFIRRQNHSKHPVLSFAMLHDREFTLAMVINAMLSLALPLAAFVLSIYFQTVRGYSALTFGLLMLIPAIFSMGGAPVSQKLYERLSSKTLIFTGLVFLSIGSLVLSLVDVDTSLVFVIGFLCIRYLGIGLLGMPITDHGMRGLPKEQTSDGSTLVNWAKLMSTSLTLAVFTMVYSVSVQHAAASGALVPEVTGVDVVFMASGLVLCAGLVVAAFLKHVPPEEAARQ